MSRGLEITLGGLFKEHVRIFIEAFPRSYAKYKKGPVDFEEDLEKYSGTIVDNAEAIFRLAARDINSYLNLYMIHANKSADEFKIIYFLGRAIERHLIHAGYVEISRVHMFIMIGLLDYRLQTKGVKKDPLTNALTKLIRLGLFDQELGQTGCYLIYKCVSTAERHRISI